MAIEQQSLLAVREMITELPESVTLSRENIMACVPAAIALWQDRTANDPHKRVQWFVESGNVSVAANVADISSIMETNGFRYEWLHESDILVSYAAKGPSLAVKFVNSYDRLKMTGPQDDYFLLAYVSTSGTITFKKPGTSSWTASNVFKIRSVAVPGTLGAMPASILPELMLVLAEILKAQFRDQNRGVALPTK